MNTAELHTATDVPTLSAREEEHLAVADMLAAAPVHMVGTKLYSLNQLCAALQVCDLLAQAYAASDMNNQGSGSIDWSEIDSIHDIALMAIGETRVGRINQLALEKNELPEPGLEPVATPVVAERKKPCDSEGGLTD
jgi:hypothetical protein